MGDPKSPQCENRDVGSHHSSPDAVGAWRDTRHTPVLLVGDPSELSQNQNMDLNSEQPSL